MTTVSIQAGSASLRSPARAREAGEVDDGQI
jgi:hypothetical protein